MERLTTMLAALPAPCSTRAAVSVAMSVASAAMTEASPATTRPSIKMGLRPCRSDSGPYTSCNAP